MSHHLRVHHLPGALAIALLSAATPSLAADSVYLNQANITVAVGSGTSPGSFNNTFDSGRTITKVIDAPSATAAEFHNQQTHIWYTANASGGGLELKFDFLAEYDLSVLHFWNYDGEGFDVDSLGFTFFNANQVQVGSLSLAPALGSSPAILAQDIALAAPLNVRYVTAFLSGSNRQVDFQNIGFTATVSVPVPEPTSAVLMGLGAMLLAAQQRRRRRFGA